MKQVYLSVFCLFTGIQVLMAQAQTKPLYDIQIELSDTFGQSSTLHKDGLDNVYFYSRLTDNSFFYQGIFKYETETSAILIDQVQGVVKIVPAEVGIYYYTADPSGDQNTWFIYYNNGTIGGTVFIDKVTVISFEMETLNNDLYYRKNQSGVGIELWKSEPTQGSQVLIKDCRPGGLSGAPHRFYKSGSLLYFLAYESGLNALLWRTDGSTDGTFSLTPASNISNYLGFMDVNGTLFFRTLHTPYKMQVWTTDGTIAGTFVVKIFPEYTQTFLSEEYAVANKYMFQFEEIDGIRWWVSDGTESGTKQLKDVPSSLLPANIVTNQDMVLESGSKRLFFTYLMNGEDGIQLWQTDGTADGTIPTVLFPEQLGVQKVTPLGRLGEQCYFVFENLNGSLNLWSSDGTQNGTSFIKTVATNVDLLIFFDGITTPDQVVFNFLNYPSFSNFDHIYINSDGTSDGTKAFYPTIPTALRSSDPSGFTASSTGSILFRASPQVNEYSIYEHLPNGMSNLQNLGSASPNYMSIPYSTTGKTFWFSNDSTLNCLFSDGSIQTFETFKTSFWSNNKITFKGKFYFVDNSDHRLWMTDGTENGTSVLVETNIGDHITAIFSTTDSMYWLQSVFLQDSIRLWRSDGSVAGTTYNPNSFPYPIGSDPALCLRNDRYQLIGFDYLSDTMHVITQGFPDLAFKAQNYDNLGGTEIINDKMYVIDAPLFVTGQGTSFRLWKCDNGINTTLHTFSHISGYLYYLTYGFENPDHLHAIQNTLLFGAGEQTNNTELWISDGTESGTVMLKDINPNGSSDPQNFVRYDDTHWLFTAFDGQTTGWWATDGTIDGTFHLATLPQNGPPNVVPNPQNPYLFQQKTLFFSMNDGLTGQEPWLLELGDSLVSGVFRPITTLANRLKITPNPASDHIIISTEGLTDSKPCTFEILNQQGQVVQSGTLHASTSGRIQLNPTLASGCYYIRLLGEGRVGRFCR